MCPTPLAGFVIGVTADRRAEEQIRLLETRGAEVLHGPVIKTHPFDNEEAVRSATAAFADRPPEILILTTGLGVRSWLSIADAMQLGDRLRAGLAATALWARGPKSVGALATAGFEVAWSAPNARYDDIVDGLAERGVDGVRVAVQLDGAGADDLCSRLEQLGAIVETIPVYRWSLPDDLSAAERLVRWTAEHRVDGLTFTARPAVDNFIEIAHSIGLEAQVRAAFTSGAVTPFCVGPVCARSFTEIGLEYPVVPERHRLGSLVQTLTNHFAQQLTEFVLAGSAVELQGRQLRVGDHADSLSDRERALLMALLERNGAVVSKRDLLRQVWTDADTDEHVVEVTVARLRKRLGPAGVGIETLPRRGYRAHLGPT